jgi:ubiquinone/menaquinone biosynthesis C-methylase UbiE
VVSLDLGCGNKKVSPYFIGVDKMKAPPVDVIADMEDLRSFTDNSVNAIVCRRALQHVKNDAQALKEIKRVLSNDGIAIIEVASFWNAKTSKLLNALKIKRYPYEIFHVYTKSILKKLIEDSNLHLITIASAPTMTFPFRNHLVIATKN